MVACPSCNVELAAYLRIHLLQRTICPALDCAWVVLQSCNLSAKIRIHTMRTPFQSGAVIIRMLAQANVNGLVSPPLCVELAAYTRIHLLQSSDLPCLGLIVGVLQPCNLSPKLSIHIVHSGSHGSGIFPACGSKRSWMACCP